MWRPGTSPNRKFVLGSEGVWHYYHSKLREIRDEWLFQPVDGGEYALDIEARFTACAKLQEAAMDELRKECELFVKGGGDGSYLIPI